MPLRVRPIQSVMPPHQKRAKVTGREGIEAFHGLPKHGRQRTDERFALSPQTLRQHVMRDGRGKVVEERAGGAVGQGDVARRLHICQGRVASDDHARSNGTKAGSTASASV